MQRGGQKMMRKTSDVCAGIVLYHPDIARLRESLSSITQQVQEVFMVDNGSNNIGEIKQLKEDFPQIVIIPFEENEGIAKALNEICNYSSEKCYKWVLTLDQDTICPEDLVDSLYSATSLGNVGIVCPAVLYEGLNLEIINKDEDVSDVKGCMTSASLTNIDVWNQIGGFREDYFIDYVDNEYCKRLQKNGYKILRVNKCIMRHQLGNARTVNVLFKNLTGSYHNPVRCYYMIRNNVAFIKEYRKDINVFKEWIKVFYIAFDCALYAENRSTTLRYMLKGAMDGIKGKLGKYEN